MRMTAVRRISSMGLSPCKLLAAFVKRAKWIIALMWSCECSCACSRADAVQQAPCPGREGARNGHGVGSRHGDDAGGDSVHSGACLPQLLAVCIVDEADDRFQAISKPQGPERLAIVCNGWAVQVCVCVCLSVCVYVCHCTQIWRTTAFTLGGRQLSDLADDRFSEDAARDVHVIVTYCRGVVSPGSLS